MGRADGDLFNVSVLAPGGFAFGDGITKGFYIGRDLIFAKTCSRQRRHERSRLFGENSWPPLTALTAPTIGRYGFQA